MGLGVVFPSIRVFDISDPFSPQIEGGGGFSGSRRSFLAAYGNYAYLSELDFSGARAFSVIDFSTPVAPIVTGGGWEVTNRFGTITATDSFVYGADVSGVSDGLWVVDVRDPADPVEVGSFDTPGESSDVAVSGEYVYLADGDAGLAIFRECGVFSDAFESGDTSMWSAAVP
jgi:hypothetical protein